MASPVIVVGHRNPDNDSICAAVGYAYLKNEIAKRDGTADKVEYIPARLGPCRLRARGSSRPTAFPRRASFPMCTPASAT